MLAMQAGMDAYIEKPMCLTIAEGRTMVKAARKFKPRHPGRHPAAFHADQQLGQRPGQERGPGQGASPCWRPTSSAPSAGRRPPRPRTSRHRSSPGGTCGPTRPSCGPTMRNIHHGWATLVGLRRRRAVLRRDRLGHPLLRPDQPRPGHRRHRPGGGPAGRGRWPIARRASSSAGGTVGGVVVGETGDIDTGTDYHRMAKLSRPRRQA